MVDRSSTEEWTQQKAQFMRSPILKRKEVSDSDGAPRKRPASNRYRVRFAPTPEYLEFPSKAYSQDPGIPPTIRIEDWSSPRAPRGFPVKTHSPLATEPVITASMFRSDPASGSWLSLIVPVTNSLCPGVKQSHLQSSEGRDIGVIGDVRHLYSSLDALTHQNALESGRNRGQAQSPAIYQPHFPVQGTKKLGAFTHECSRTRPLSDLQLFVTGSFWDSDTDDEEKRRKINNFNKSVRRHSTGDTGTRRCRKRQRIPARLNSEPKMYTSHPQTAITTPLWDDAGLAQGHTHEVKEDTQDGEDLIHEGGGHGDKIATFNIPVLPGVTLQPELQHTAITRFYERQGLAQTPARNSFSSKRPSATSWTINQFSVPFDSGSDEVPYPDVFDLDFYFQNLLPTTTTSSAAIVVLSPPTFTPDSLVSNSESRDSINTPTPAPRRRFSTTPIMAPIHAPGSAYVTHNAHCLTLDNASGSNLQETVTACDYPSPPFDLEEEHSSSRSEDSDGPSSHARDSGPPSISPGSEWYTDSSEADDSHNRGGDAMTGIMGTNAPAPSVSSAPLSTSVPGAGDLNVNLLDDMGDTNSTPRTQNHNHFEMNQIRATLRNTYAPANRHYDSNNDNSIQDEHNESQVSFVESYSSGSTLSHRHYHHHWRVRHTSQPEAEDQRLSPVFEYPNSTTPSSTTPKAGFVMSEVERRGCTDSQVTQAPEPVARSRCSADVGLGFGVGFQFTFGMRNQPEPVQDRDRYRGSAFTRGSGVFGFSPILDASVDGEAQETTRDACAVNRRSRDIGAPFPCAARPIGGRVMPQKF